MLEFLHSLQEWMNQNQSIVLWVGVGSGLLLILSIVSMPWVVSKIPQDYFLKPARERIKIKNPAVYIIIMILKNTLGLGLLLIGIVMLFLPGPGVLAILVGVVLLNFPGKFKLERWLISLPGVLKSINWMRQKRGKRSLLIVGKD